METQNNHLTSFDDFLDTQYGKIGTEKRTEFEIGAKAFAISEIIKEEHRLYKLTFGKRVSLSIG